MKYLFGPVNSRRLGRSLGIDLIPSGICTLNCIYCEAGPKAKLTCQRDEYTPTADILAEFDAFIADRLKFAGVDVYTITAKGEPTLHTGIGRVIRYARERVGSPVVVLTNGTLLHLEEVRADLMDAHIVVPSLDAAREESYNLINRPHRCACLADLLEGLRLFSRQFRGEMWLEILFAKGVNDAPEDIAALNEAIHEISPARVQINTVVRPPLHPSATALDERELLRIARQLCGNVEIIAYPPTQAAKKQNRTTPEEIFAMLSRRPCTAREISDALRLHPVAVEKFLHALEESGKIHLTIHDGMEYYQCNQRDNEKGII